MRHNVALAVHDPLQAVIASGICPGEKIILNGVATVHPGGGGDGEADHAAERWDRLQASLGAKRPLQPGH